MNTREVVRVMTLDGVSLIGQEELVLTKVKSLGKPDSDWLTLTFDQARQQGYLTDEDVEMLRKQLKRSTH